MAGLARLSVEDIAGYFAGDSLSDASIEDQLRQLEEQECSELDSEGSEPGGDSSEDEDDDRIEAMLVGAYSHPSTAGPSTMPSNRDSLLLLDPDFNRKLFSLASSSYHDYVLVIFWIPGSEDQSTVSSAEATSDEEVAGGGATRGRERYRGHGARRRGSIKVVDVDPVEGEAVEVVRQIEEGNVEGGRGVNVEGGRGVALEWQNILQKKSVLHKLCDVFHLVLCFA